MEIRIVQKTTLYELLKLKQRINPEALDELIKKTQVSMEPEDIAWVEKHLEQP
jgi:hypothetical protein